MSEIAVFVVMGGAIWCFIAVLGVDCAFEIGAAVMAGFFAGVLSMALAQAAKGN